MSKRFITQMKKPAVSLCLLAICGLAQPLFAQQEPLGILLTWKEDPLTTMVVDWHTELPDPEVLHISERGSDNWRQEPSRTLPFPHSDRTIQRVELAGLRPGTSYSIRFGKSEKAYYFTTMPADIAREPIRIAIGGDSMHAQELMEKTNRQVASYDPHFAVIGGDLAYANGDPKNVARWYAWFDAVKNTLIREDGRIIPLLLGIGNHEVQRRVFAPEEEMVFDDASREKMAPFYYGLFAFPSHPGYGVLDFGSYLSFFLLDSDHSNPIVGKQTEWLKRELAIRNEVSQLLTLYHVPAYPSVRDFNGRTQRSVRENWVPLLEDAGVTLVFENHDHAYKRTYPIRKNRIDPEGIVYIGDGSWGTRIREVHDPAATWYLDTALSAQAFTLLTLQGSGYSLISIDADGNVIDSYPSLPRK